MSKIDSSLGARVNKHLLSVGVETPTVPKNLEASSQDKRATIEGHFRSIMLALGLDMTDDSLVDTPTRVAKMYVDEIFYGLDYYKFPKCTTVENKMRYEEMVLEKNVNVQSNCEHHLVVISGHATVAYIPKNKVLGLSKINRIVEFFSKRPQIQERLTEQIYHALSFILETDDVAVLVNAEHYCVKSRGIKDVGSSTITTKLGGAFKSNPSTRAEFMAQTK
jgi:GTP cyclohydrolase I